jgi:hypothetical protein
MKNKKWSNRNRVIQSAACHSATLLVTLTLQIATSLVARGAEPLDEWKPVSSGTTSNFRGITYGNGQFIAVGEKGLIATSPDGTAWTVQTSGTTNWLHGITTLEGRFVVVGSVPSSDASGIVLISEDGNAWKEYQDGIVNKLESIAYGNGRFVAVGGLGNPGLPSIFTSVDGANWKPTWQGTNVDVDPGWVTDVTYGNSQFVAVYPGYTGINGASSLISKDGYSWSRHNIPMGIERVAFGNGLFLGVGQSLEYQNRYYIGHATAYTSPDGVTWTQHADIVGDMWNKFYDVTWGGGQFVAVGNYYTISSSDGTNWVQRTAYFDSPSRNGIAFGNGRFVVVGAGGYILNSGAIGKLGASLAPNGQFIGTLTGMSGQKYSIQYSPRLGDWTPFTNVTINNGIGQFNDLLTNSDSRFYKALPINK